MHMQTSLLSPLEPEPCVSLRAFTLDSPKNRSVSVRFLTRLRLYAAISAIAALTSGCTSLFLHDPARQAATAAAKKGIQDSTPSAVLYLGNKNLDAQLKAELGALEQLSRLVMEKKLLQLADGVCVDGRYC